MKKSLLVAALFFPYFLFAQGVALVKTEKLLPVAEKNPADICFLPETYEQISNEMFNAGNPKYIWVDLMKDHYIDDGDGLSYNLYVFTNSKADRGTIKVPDAVQEAYAKKMDAVRYFNR